MKRKNKNDHSKQLGKIRSTTDKGTSQKKAANEKDN